MGEESARRDSRALLEAARAAGESASGWWLDLTMAAQAAVTPYALDLLTIQFITKVKEALGADAISLLVANEAEDELVARVAVGLNHEISVGISIPRGEGMAGQVLASRLPLIVSDLSGWTLISPALRESGMTSVVAVPIVHDDSVLGVLHAGSRLADRFDTADAELLGLVAERLAPAIARVRLLQAERDARRWAEDRAHRLARLEDLTATLAQTKTLDEVAANLQELVGQLGLTEEVLWSTVWLRKGDLLVRASGACVEDVEAIDLDKPLVLCEAVRTGRTVFARSAAELEARLPQFHRLRPGEESLAIVPMMVGGEPIGALRVTSPQAGAFGAGERELLQLVVHRAAQAADRARMHEQREGVARIQRLPRGRVPGDGRSSRLRLRPQSPRRPGPARARRHLPDRHSLRRRKGRARRGPAPRGTLAAPRESAAKRIPSRPQQRPSRGGGDPLRARGVVGTDE